MRAAVKPPDMQSTGVQEEVAQLTDPQHSQRAFGLDSIVADTYHSRNTTVTVEPSADITNEAATEYRTTAAIPLKNRATEYMAISNKVELKAFVE